MKYYDLHIDSEKLEEIIEMAKLLGFSGIFVNVQNIEERRLNENLKQFLSPEKNNEIELIRGVIIKAKNKEELKAQIEKYRRKVEIIAVYGGDYEINRLACEDNRVDILYHPELGRNDSGLDHICIKSAAENNVAIEINFNEILKSKNRAKILSFMRKNIKLCKKYEAKIIITSGATEKWEMRAPRELASIGYVLGLDLKDAIDAVSINPETKINENREKLKGNIIGNVRIVEEF